MLASGSLLIAPEVPGVERYFKPGIHFVSFDSADDASVKATQLLENRTELVKICEAGHDRAKQLILCHSFWIQIDTALGFEAIVDR